MIQENLKKLNEEIENEKTLFSRHCEATAKPSPWQSRVIIAIPYKKKKEYEERVLRPYRTAGFSGLLHCVRNDERAMSRNDERTMPRNDGMWRNNIREAGCPPLRDTICRTPAAGCLKIDGEQRSFD